MAFPYVAQEGFEDGTKGIFDVETDTASKLDFPSYRELARDSRTKVAPFRGAYCMRVDLKITAGTDAYVQETGSFDISADGTLSFSFMFYASPNLTMATTDEFSIWQMWSSTNTEEASIVVNYTTANGYRLGAAATGETSAYTPLELGKWHHVAADIVLDDGGSNDGTFTLYLNGTQVAQLTTIDQGAITSAVLGAVGLDAGTTDGVLLFDDLIIDDARLFPRLDRWSENQWMTKTGHAFVGPGHFEAQLRDGGSANSILEVFDTDRAENSSGHAPVEILEAALANQTLASSYPVYVRKGAYVVLSGTNPEAIIRVRQAAAWGSDGAVRQLGARVG